MLFKKAKVSSESSYLIADDQYDNMKIMAEYIAFYFFHLFFLQKLAC